MADKLDKLFNFYSLTIINAAIIVLAIATGGGLFFFETGLIHLIALIFIALAVLRITYHHYTYDPILEKFIHASSFALLVFAGSHIIEYVSMMYLNHYQDAVFANVANFYLISSLFIIAGATYFSYINHPEYAVRLRNISFALIAGFLMFSIYLFMNDKTVSLEMSEIWPYFYAGALLIIGILVVLEINKIRHLTPIMVGFTEYMRGALLLILVAIIPNIFYEPLESIGIPAYVSIYISHFVFYAALSLFFLAFKHLSHLGGGVYEDLEALKRA